MKKIFNSYSSLLISGIFFIASCVPSRQFEDIKTRQKQCEENVAQLKTETQDLSTKNTELASQNAKLQKDVNALEKDTSVLGMSYRRAASLYDELTKSYDKIAANNDKLVSSNSEETKKMIAKYNTAQEELQKKEDALKKLEKTLSDKETNLDKLNVELQQREGKVRELQGILNKKDSVVLALKNTVSDALLGFKDKGLTVTQKNGKVYVSLEERLLFASASIVVDPKGQEALKQLAKVLEKNTDINVLIEGHTDNVPYKTGGAIKDNWDLSVMRATSVVKIITVNSKVAPVRLTAAGRGEYLPLDTDNTSEAKKKNRRIEIILTPKISELLKVLETN